MANELQFSFLPGKTCYFLVRNRVGLIWNSSGGTGAFSAYSQSFYTDYDISATEQGAASAYYVGSMPAAIGPGTYNVVGKQQVGGSVDELDPTVANGDVEWNGSVVLPLSDLATSGQVSQGLPVRLAKGEMVRNFPIYLKSAADHVTPLVSGVVSGQISRDGGLFGALQSGAFTEIGLGFYSLQALTSGDLNATTAALRFSANGISGGTADPLAMTVVLQRTSGN